jgi:hypothetical protein
MKKGVFSFPRSAREREEKWKMKKISNLMFELYDPAFDMR